ncbi:MAG: DUF3488 domain-containing protein [Nitrospira sp.]|nr:DUF3488 domain-containing protein [Nitrospira sp.]
MSPQSHRDLFDDTGSSLRLSSILLAATGFASLTLAIALPFWLLALAGAAFAVALLRVNLAPGFSELFPHLRLSALTWNIFLLLAFAGFWIDLLLVSQELLPAGIHFLVLLLVNKLSNLDQRRIFFTSMPLAPSHSWPPPR